ncbi:MBL fold metallo-hydrolase [Actinoallomurus rhizosphaericola]|uniref:MBL fold metallo-hydrolase n=1 Tax=Actinoallomurus rhizosphaericola TaxID=2952536 RepID=UPI0020927D61|nr:MBL fold metallo-hydrolase [Actinoallomurus rhizosphaericola]MCO5995366.1 MBL fold metallo-hydrolase [Actinoallomurus rhizosphaericola]
MRLTTFGHAAVLVETGSERILVDPWLTPRLDRFWERWPAMPDGLLDVLDGGVDHIVFSHHHFDHHHFPSLRLLSEDPEVDFDEVPARAAETHCVWPRRPGRPRPTASGLGHQAIGWTLRRLGFTRSTAVQPGDTVQLGDTRLRTSVSRVPFPEMPLLLEGPDATVMLCGDAMLHPDTQTWFAGPDAPRVDVALIPAHSIAPPGVLTERRPLSGVEDVQARARANFDRWVATVDAGLTIPSSFGWRVGGENGEFSWCNKAIFPFTPWQALERLKETGRPGALWGPGQTLEVAGGRAALSESRYDFASVFEEVTLDPDAKIPAFSPEHDRVGTQREPTGELVGRLMDHLVGTELWYRAVDDGDGHVLSVTEDTGTTRHFVLDFAGGRVLPFGGETDGGEGYTRIAGSTLQALFDAELLFGSSYALWASNDAVLSAVFHDPRWYVRHVNAALAGSGR